MYAAAVCGTTNSGGGAGAGTIFFYSPSQYFKETLYNFAAGASVGGSDGEGPEAPLTAIGQNTQFYGTTYSGGVHGLGTIFQYNYPYEYVLYSFKGAPDAGGGQGAGAALVQLNGIYYGTTVAGGDAACAPSASGGGGCGAVFSFNPSTGTEQVLYAFKGGKDGEVPLGGPVAYNGELYGTTQLGGAYGGGTVYEIDPASGSEKVIHSFGLGYDGAYPYAGLVAVAGMLYGTTYAGGNYGRGTVFALTP